MEWAEFPGLEEPIDEEEIEIVVRGASPVASASASKRRGRDTERSVPILNGSDDDRKQGMIRRSQGRRLPKWGAAADRGTSASSSRTVKYPLMSFGGRIVYGRTYSEVEKATVELMEILKSKKQNMDKISLGFDIEWRPNFRKGETPKKAAVMQICVDTDHCFVMHIFHSGIPSTLGSLMADRSYVKVGVSIASDAAKISRDYNVNMTSLDDLSDLANLKLGGSRKQWLAKPKRIRMGNWEAKVLSREQLHYAATDAFASWYLYEVLRNFPEAVGVMKMGSLRR
ncbi:unnamed protein product [Spirodela intermedia]|uniref:3'-5' exonuclease n=1 Tax=Spirodela intermedia TaxID=51605 RepID=A0A7I8IE80_SPIIN|nr:unnamed protein product [Spirodela intermedia]CAA6655403.1 unnamed protein product [Spirodela intermedia]